MGGSRSGFGGYRGKSWREKTSKTTTATSLTRAFFLKEEVEDDFLLRMEEDAEGQTNEMMVRFLDLDVWNLESARFTQCVVLVFQEEDSTTEVAGRSTKVRMSLTTPHQLFFF